MSEYPTYLIHYGIEGQKWGVRRFQNEDGTYTDEGLLRRKEKTHFVKEQEKTGKAFNKVTSKIQRDQARGKAISDKRYNKAVELGTKHRALDYISKNPRPYLKQHGLEKGSKAKFGLQLGAGIATAAYGGEGIIAGAIVERKLEKMFMNKWMQRQYGDVFDKCRDLTIKDLEKHGISANKKETLSEEKGKKKIEGSIGEVKSGVKTTAKGVGNVTKAAWRTTRMAGASAGSVIKGTVKGIGSGVRTVAKGGDIQEGAKNFSKEVKTGGQNAKARIVRTTNNDIMPVLNDGVHQVGSGVKNTAVGVGHTSRDVVNGVKKKRRT